MSSFGEPLSFIPKGSDPCPHTSGRDVIEMAEKELKNKGIEETFWEGYRGVFLENLPDYMWKSIKIVIQRENNAWVTKEIDRRENLSPKEEEGFQLISPK